MSASRPLLVAVAGTLVLGAGKLAAAIVTGSHAVLASALDSLADAGVSLVNLLLARAAARPPDDDHPFGHGKAEAIAALVQGLVLSALAVAIAVSAVARLVHGALPPQSVLATAAIGVSMVGSFLISRHLMAAADATGSLVLRADATHYRMDLYSGAGVLVALGFGTWVNDARPDAIASLAVCVLIGKDVVGLVREAVDELMDKALPSDQEQAMRAVLAGFEQQIRSYHALRGRKVGPVTFVQVHVVMDPDLTIREAHHITDEIEEAFRRRFAPADVIVHADADDDS